MIAWLLFNGGHIKKDFICLEIRVGRFFNSTNPSIPHSYSLCLSLQHFFFCCSAFNSVFSPHKRDRSQKNEKPKGTCGSQISQLKAVKGDQVYKTKRQSQTSWNWSPSVFAVCILGWSLRVITKSIRLSMTVFLWLSERLLIWKRWLQVQHTTGPVLIKLLP